MRVKRENIPFKLIQKVYNAHLKCYVAARGDVARARSLVVLDILIRYRHSDVIDRWSIGAKSAWCANEPLSTYACIAIFTSSLRSACRMDFLDSDIVTWAARWQGFAAADGATGISFT